MTSEEFLVLRQLFDEQLDDELKGGERHGPPTYLSDTVRRQVQSLLEVDEQLGNCFLTPLLDSMMTVRDDVVAAEPGQPIGQVLNDRYVLERVLGSAMSEVYLASDRRLSEKQWVVKILKLGSVNHSWFRERLNEEMKSLARLNHHGIVAVYDGGTTDGNRPYFVMSYVDGTTLRELIDRSPLDAISTLLVVKQLAAALAHAHRKDVVHLDVKPSNILIRDIGGTDPHVWLIDFGIAKIRSPEADDKGRVPAGTRGYMSREQAEGAADEGCDVYSLAVVCFEALTGRVPTDADLDQLEVVRSGRREHPIDSNDENTGLIALPDEIQLVIARALTRDFSQRTSTPQRFATELENALSPFVFWQRALMATERFFRSARNGSRAAIATLLVLAALVVGAIYGAVVNVTSPTPVSQPTISSPESRNPMTGPREKYLATLIQFRRNVQFQVGLVLLGALLIYRAGRPLTVPFLGVSVSTNWICYLIALVLVTSWLDFGFYLDDLIKWRAEAWGSMLASGTTAQASDFFDSGFIDGWFISFRPSEHAIRTDYRLLTQLIFFGTYGPLLAANHAFSIMLLWFAPRWSVAESWSAPTMGWWLTRSFAWVAAGLILLSHVQFRLGGNNPNRMQEFVGVLTLVFCYLSWRHAADARRATPRQRKDHSTMAKGGDVFNRIVPLEVAAIGDSLTTGFHVASPWWMIWTARRVPSRGWFVDTTGSIESFARRLGRDRAIVTHQYATVAAKVDYAGGRGLVERLMATHHFADQVSSVRALARFPDLVLIWIGHNNLDWARRSSDQSPVATDRLFADITVEFIDAFRQQLGRLLEGAVQATHPVTIVVFALIDFDRFFAARSNVEALRACDSALYPRLVDDYRYFESLKPAYRDGVVRLSKILNSELAQLIETTRSGALRGDRVILRFSGALHDTDISSATTLSEVDGWHPSRLGHTLLAASAYAAVTATPCSDAASPRVV